MIHWTDGFHRYIQNFASKCSWIHILKCTWNFLQNRPHTGSQIRSQTIPKDWDCPLHIFRPQCFETRTQSKKKFGRNSNTWKLTSILLKDEWVNQEIREELKRFMKTNENEDTTVLNLWNTAKAVLRGEYVAIQASLKKLEKTHIHKLTLHLKELEKE